MPLAQRPDEAFASYREPEYAGFRRDDALVSFGALDDQLTSLVLQIPG